jgi:MFS transporter, YNFM family, putative membrane transport protein
MARPSAYAPRQNAGIGTSMPASSHRPFGLQTLVFAVVVAAFTNIYITQPVLPVIAREFGVNETGASLTVAGVVFGIALATLPFGWLADRFAMRPIILVGGAVVSVAGLVCAVTHNFALLVTARFTQGLFLPALTTCVAAYLANSLPVARLNVVMGSYVSATVAGGLGGRLLGGWIHPPLHWRYAFVSASVLLLAAAIAAARWLPNAGVHPKRHEKEIGFRELLSSWAIVRIYAVAFGAFWVFSATFNYLPFYLSAPPIGAPTAVITLLYLSYLVGAAMGPNAGRIANRIGSGATMMLGAVLFAVSLAGTLFPSLVAVLLSLMGVCAGFFATHAAASGALNSRLASSRGRGNALYVLFYYVGGSIGITAGGYAYRVAGWPAVVAVGTAMLTLPFSVGLLELRAGRKPRAPARWGK